mgnify:CR=1 FL=1
MAAWWQSLTPLEHILLYLAVPATLILIIQTVLLLSLIHISEPTRH